MPTREYEQSKNDITVVMLPKTRAEFYGMKAPHVPMGDMVIAYQIDKGDGQQHLITYEDMERFKLDATQLHRDAFENTQACHPAVVQTMEETLGLPPLKPGPVPTMYVVTNKQGEFGAAAICYPGMMEQLAKRIGGDYVILPSSIHEMLVVQTKGADLGKLESLLHRVNREEVSPQERLSDTVYCYDERAHMVMRASVYEQLQRRDVIANDPTKEFQAVKPSIRKELKDKRVDAISRVSDSLGITKIAKKEESL